MSIQKLIPVLQDALTLHQLADLTPVQKESLSKFKQGADFIAIAPAGSGKSTAIVMGVIQRLEQPTEDDAPRAIIYVKDKDAAKEMEAAFLKIGRRTDLRIVVLHDKRQQVYQRIDLYEGSDVVIGTAKQIHEMYLQNGINLANVKLYIIDDVEEILKQPVHTEIIRVYESVPKCQTIAYANQETNKFEKIEEQIFKNPIWMDFMED